MLREHSPEVCADEVCLHGLGPESIWDGSFRKVLDR